MSRLSESRSPSPRRAMSRGISRSPSPRLHSRSSSYRRDRRSDRLRYYSRSRSPYSRSRSRSNDRVRRHREKSGSYSRSPYYYRYSRSRSRSRSGSRARYRDYRYYSRDRYCSSYSRSRSRSRSYDRRHHRYRSRSRSLSRSPSERHLRSRSRSRSRSPSRRFGSRSRSRSQSPNERRPKDKYLSNTKELGALVSEFVDGIAQQHKNGTEGESQSQALADMEEMLMKKLGIPASFDSTKGKYVHDADVSAVRLPSKRQPRQYMNRKCGFNKPLPSERNR